MGIYDIVRRPAFLDTPVRPEQPVALYTPPAPVAATTPPSQESGYLAGTGQALVRGIAEIPVAGGHALEWNEDVARGKAEPNLMNRAGKGIADFSEQVRDLVPEPKAGDNAVKKAVFGGVESLPLSAAYAIPATAGAIIGSGLGIAGSIGGAVAGQAATAPIMYRSSAQETLEQVKKLRPNVDQNAATDVAKKAGHAEWIGESISDIPEALIYSRIPGLSAGVKTVRELLKPGVRQFAKNVALSLPAEQLGEGYTAYKQAQAVNEVLPAERQTDPWQAVKEQAGPTTVMTVLMSALGLGLQRHRATSIAKALTDPDAPVQARGRAAGQVYGLLEESNGKEAADNFLAHAYRAIGDEATTGTAPYGLDLENPVLLEAPQPQASTEPVPEVPQQAPAEPVMDPEAATPEDRAATSQQAQQREAAFDNRYPEINPNAGPLEKALAQGGIASQAVSSSFLGTPRAPGALMPDEQAAVEAHRLDGLYGPAAAPAAEPVVNPESFLPEERADLVSRWQQRQAQEQAQVQEREAAFDNRYPEMAGGIAAPAPAPAAAAPAGLDPALVYPEPAKEQAAGPIFPTPTGGVDLGGNIEVRGGKKEEVPPVRGSDVVVPAGLNAAQAQHYIDMVNNGRAAVKGGEANAEGQRGQQGNQEGLDDGRRQEDGLLGATSGGVQTPPLPQGIATPLMSEDELSAIFDQEAEKLRNEKGETPAAEEPEAPYTGPHAELIGQAKAKLAEVQARYDSELKRLGIENPNTSNTPGYLGRLKKLAGEISSGMTRIPKGEAIVAAGGKKGNATWDDNRVQGEVENLKKVLAEADLAHPQHNMVQDDGEEGSEHFHLYGTNKKVTRWNQDEDGIWSGLQHTYDNKHPNYYLAATGDLPNMERGPSLQGMEGEGLIKDPYSAEIGNSRAEAKEALKKTLREASERDEKHKSHPYTREELEKINGGFRHELRQIARARGIEGHGSKKYATLIEEILKGQEQAPAKNEATEPAPEPATGAKKVRDTAQVIQEAIAQAEAEGRASAPQVADFIARLKAGVRPFEAYSLAHYHGGKGRSYEAEIHDLYRKISRALEGDLNEGEPPLEPEGYKYNHLTGKQYNRYLRRDVDAHLAKGEAVNDSGVYLDAEEIDIPIPPKAKHQAQLRLVQDGDGKFRVATSISKLSGDFSGSGSAVSIFDKQYDSREEALHAALDEIERRWPEEDHDSIAPNGANERRALARKALAEFRAGIGGKEEPETEGEEAASEEDGVQQDKPGKLQMLPILDNWFKKARMLPNSGARYRSFETFYYSLAGDANLLTRQEILKALTGKAIIPKKQAGIHAVKDAIKAEVEKGNPYFFSGPPIKVRPEGTPEEEWQKRVEHHAQDYQREIERGERDGLEGVIRAYVHKKYHDAPLAKAIEVAFERTGKWPEGKWGRIARGEESLASAEPQIEHKGEGGYIVTWSEQGKETPHQKYFPTEFEAQKYKENLWNGKAPKEVEESAPARNWLAGRPEGERRIIEEYLGGLEKGDKPKLAEYAKGVRAGLTPLAAYQKALGRGANESDLNLAHNRLIMLGRIPPRMGEQKGRLLLLACSGRKDKASYDIPAWLRYQGVNYQTLNTLRDQPLPEVVILSAKYSFIRPETFIANYDQQMDTARANQLADEAAENLKWALREKEYDEVLLAGGQEYQGVMRWALDELEKRGELKVKTRSAVAGGIGDQRAQLKVWVERGLGKEPERAQEPEPQEKDWQRPGHESFKRLAAGGVSYHYTATPAEAKNPDQFPWRWEAIRDGKVIASGKAWTDTGGLSEVKEHGIDSGEAHALAADAAWTPENSLRRWYPIKKVTYTGTYDPDKHWLPKADDTLYIISNGAAVIAVDRSGNHMAQAMVRDGKVSPHLDHGQRHMKGWWKEEARRYMEENGLIGKGAQAEPETVDEYQEPGETPEEPQASGREVVSFKEFAKTVAAFREGDHQAAKRLAKWYGLDSALTTRNHLEKKLATKHGDLRAHYNFLNFKKGAFDRPERKKSTPRVWGPPKTEEQKIRRAEMIKKAQRDLRFAEKMQAWVERYRNGLGHNYLGQIEALKDKLKRLGPMPELANPLPATFKLTLEKYAAAIGKTPDEAKAEHLKRLTAAFEGGELSIDEAIRAGVPTDYPELFERVLKGLDSNTAPESVTGSQAENVPPAADGSKGAPARRDVAKREAERALFRDLTAIEEIRELAGSLDRGAFAARAQEAVAKRIIELIDLAETPEIRELYESMLVDGKPTPPQIFYDALHKLARKAYEAAEREKNRDPEVYRRSLEFAIELRGLHDELDTRTFKEGWDHYLQGKTRSTLPQNADGSHSLGYQDAKKWVENTAEGKAWFEGKRGEKEKSTGEALKRAQDRQRRDLDAVDAADMEKAWETMQRVTARADFFPNVLAEGATPGASEWFERFRRELATFSEYFMWEGIRDFQHKGKWANKAKDIFTGRHIYSGGEGKFQNIDRDEGTHARRVELAKEIARDYQDALRELSRVLEGAASLDEIEARLQPIFGHEKSWTETSFYKDHVALFRQNMRDIERLLPSEARSEWERSYSIWEKLKKLENDEKLKKDKKDSLLRPRLDRVVREGLADTRKGRDISAAELKRTFGFADVTIGNYVTSQQAQDHLNYVHDAFMTMARMLGAKPQQLGFGGRLHFAIGALGHGKAAAHFSLEQPKEDGSTVPVINVTNTRGDGTVLHEYFHAIDLMAKDPALRKAIASVKKLLTHTPPGPEFAVETAERFLSGRAFWQHGGRKDKGSPKEQALFALTDYYHHPAHSDKRTEYYSNALKLDKGATEKLYWSNDLEIFARAAESWGFDHLKIGIKGRDDYLVSDWAADGKVTEATHRGTPYPKGAERTRLNELMGELVLAMEWTDQGPVLAKGHKWHDLLPDKEARAPYEKARLEAIEKIDEIAERLKAREAEKAQKRKEEEQAAIFGTAEPEPPATTPEEEADKAAAVTRAYFQSVARLVRGDAYNFTINALDSMERGDLEGAEILLRRAVNVTEVQSFRDKALELAERIHVLWATTDDTLPEPPAMPEPTREPQAYLSEEELSAMFDEAAAALAESKQEEPQADPPGAALTRQSWTREDAQEILDYLDKGRMIYFGGNDLGLPAIQEIQGAQHLGMGVFKAVTPEYTVMFDGGGGMEHTQATGKAYTILQVEKGSFPYDAEKVRQILKGAAGIKEEAASELSDGDAAHLFGNDNPAAGNGVTVNFNQAKNGIEISFANKPDKETIERVKQMGFRWSGHGKLWYAKYSAIRSQFAKSLQGEAQPAPPTDEEMFGTAEPLPTLSEEQEKTAQQLIKDMAKEGITGIDEALRGLVEIFGGGSGKLNAFPGPDLSDENYAKAKPHFEKAAEAFAKVGRSFSDFVSLFFRHIIGLLGEGVKPYAVRFAREYEPIYRAQFEGQGSQQEEGPAQAGASPYSAVASFVERKLSAGESVSWQELFREADIAFGGTQAQGSYTPKDAYDAMELGVNRYIMAQPQYTPAVDLETAERRIGDLDRIVGRVATQSKRVAETEEMQQFSTPPTHAYVLAWAANLKEGELVLEPSAGTGDLAIFAKLAGARVLVNELSARRLSILRELPFDAYYAENAEQIHHILPQGVRPSAVLMNPPFSSTAGRIPGARDTMIQARHIEQALKRLAPGGRLVALAGDFKGSEAQRAWWSKISKEYAVRATIKVDGGSYSKYGTTFDNQIIVIDKTAPHGEVVTGKVASPAEALTLLEGVRNDRPESETATGVDRNAPLDAGSGAAAGAGQGGSDRGETGAAGPAPVGGVRGGTGNAPGAGPRGDNLGGSGVSGHEQSGAGGKNAPPGGRPGRGDGELPQGGAHPEAGGASGDRAGEPGGVSSLTLEQGEEAQGAIIQNTTFEPYTPKKVKIAGAKQHPTPLVESAALASVSAPDPTYVPNLPKKIVEKGLLSDAQLEAVVYAGQAFAQVLPDGTRRGFFIGDGTGVGKGREISGIVMDALRNGHGGGKAVWISKTPALMADARRDWSGIDGDPAEIFSVAGKVKASDAIDRQKGILFSAYSALRVTGDAGAANKLGIATYARGSVVFHPPPVVFGGRSVDKNDPQYQARITGAAKRDRDGNIVYPAESLDGKRKFTISHALVGALISGSLHQPTTGEGKITYPRVQQIVDWVGKDFDGVIVFDEAHNMGNLLPTRGARGMKLPSEQALAGKQLREALPKARILLVSATGATEVSNLAYAERLGLWGDGTDFSSLPVFIGQMSRSTSAMEFVAQSMKQMGLYISRSLTFEGIKYSKLEHEVTPYQRAMYDRLAEGWQGVLTGVEEALVTTGTMPDPEEGGRPPANARKIRNAILSQFWGSHQRFFNQILTSLAMPSVFENIDRDLKEGRSVVLQSTRTNEADQENALQRAAANRAEDKEDKDDDLDLTPREQLIRFIETYFPVAQMEQYADGFDDEGNPIIKVRPVQDSQGKPVMNEEATAARDQLIADIRNMEIPDPALQQITDRYGIDNVAEITGRKQRVIYDENGKPQVVKHGDAAVTADMKAFNEGKKRILFFSGKGDTGFSFHGDRNFSNHQQRSHYGLQMGWRADVAMQGLGRSNRTNQAEPPIYRLVTTDIPAQKRFNSSIARRLEQLGALSAGQRDTAGGSLFSSSDNLENSYSQAAVNEFFKNAVGNQAIQARGYEEIPADLLKQMGLERVLNDDDNSLVTDNLPKVTQFLNRLLSLRIDTQHTVFNLFADELEAQIELAKSMGRFDDGLETVSNVGAEVKDEQEVYRDAKTNASARYLHIDYLTPARVYSFEDADEEVRNATTKNGVKTGAWFRNNQSGKVAAIYKTNRTHTEKDGTITEVMGVKRPSGNRYETVKELDVKKKWTRIEADEAQRLWEEEQAKRPSTLHNDLHLVVGGILPIWSRFNNEHIHAARIATSNGKRYLGRQIMPRDLEETLERLDVRSATAQMKGAQLAEAAMSGGTVVFSNGATLFKVRVSNDERLEFALKHALNSGSYRQLTQAGVISETIQWKERFFIPTGARAGEVLDRMMAAMNINATKIKREEGETLNFLGLQTLYERLAGSRSARAATGWLRLMGQQVYREGAKSYRDFAQGMKRALKDLWGRFKGEMLGLYQFAKKKLAEERGLFGRDIGAANGLRGQFSDLTDRKAKLEIDDSGARLLKTSGSGRLNEFLHHPELFERFPGLKKVFVNIRGKSVFFRANGITFAEDEIIHLNGGRDLRRVLLHEVQHLLQYEGGFARGGSPETQGGVRQYRRLAGEEEARRVESRSDLSAAGRVGSPYSGSDVTKASDLVVSLRAGEARSVGEEHPTAKLEAEIRTLRPRVEAAYEKGNFPLAERLDARLEGLYEKLDAALSELEQDEEGSRHKPGSVDTEVSIEEDLANAYEERIANPRAIYDRKDAVGVFRYILIEHGADPARVKKASDETILAAAQDAYDYIAGRGKQKAARPLPGRGEPTTGAAPSREEIGNPANTEAPAFRRWFGKSKVVDEDDKPLVVYHGTDADFNKFEGRVAGTAGYFTIDRRYASMYGKVQEFYLSMQNPLNLMEHDSGIMEALNNEGVYTPGKWRKVLAGFGVKGLRLDSSLDPKRKYDFWEILDPTDSSDDSNLVERIKAAGYDGIILPEGGGVVSAETYVPFAPTQIKSATGNRGSFDPSDPNTLNDITSVIPMAARLLVDAAGKVKSEELVRLVNPLDYSRTRELIEDYTPENFRAAVGWLFANPVFQAERDPAKQPLVDAGAQRDIDRMHLYLQMHGLTAEERGPESKMQKIKRILRWGNNDLVTKWGQIQEEAEKLTKAQRDLLDRVVVEGDRTRRIYESLEEARKVRGLGGLDQRTFDLYQRVQQHLNGTVADTIEEAIKSLGETSDVSAHDIEQHLKAYRRQRSKLKGWLTRDHGQGDYAVVAHRVVKELSWQRGDEYHYLRFHPGGEVMKGLFFLASEHGVKLGIGPTGAIYARQKEGGNLDAFLAESQTVIPEIVERTGAYPQQMVYSRRVNTRAGARKLQAEIERDRKSAFPFYAVDGEEFAFKWGHASKISMAMHNDLKSDLALEAVLVEALDQAKKKGEVSRADYDALKAKVFRHTAEVLLGKAAGKYQIRRAPWLIEGYKKDDVLGLYGNYMSGTAGMFSKALYAKKQFENFRATPSETRAWAESYIKSQLKNQTQGDMVSGNLRSLASLWYMGLKPASALINATQLWTLGQAELSRFTDKPLKMMSQTQRDIFGGKLTADEKELLRSDMFQVHRMQTAVAEISGHQQGSSGKLAKGLHFVTDRALALFQLVEENNRKTAILAAYRVFRNSGLPAGELDQNAMREAARFDDHVNFEMGRANLPGFARNPVGRTFYALQSFTWNSFNWIYNRATSGDKKQMMALARYAAAMVVVGGVMALPGGDELDRILRRILGKSYRLELESWSRKHAKEYGTLGEALHAWVWHGAPAGVPALAGYDGINVSNSIRTQIPVLSQILQGESPTEAAAGVFGGLYQKGELAATYARRGMYGRAVESAAPEAVSGVMRAMRQHEKGVETSHGKPVFDEHGRRLKYDTTDMLQRMAGFQPMEQSRRMDVTMTGEELASVWKSKRSEALDRLRAAEGKAEKRARLREIVAFNEALHDSQVRGLVPPIKAKTIKAALTFKPNKRKVLWEHRQM